jgi:vitamin B12 transporter
MIKQKTKRLLCFKKWSNRRFAVFNSIGKVIKIGVLSASYLLVTTELKADNNQDSILVIYGEDINEVTIQAEQPLPNALQPAITILSVKDQSSLPWQSLENLIENNTTLDIRQRGPFSLQSDISLRAGTFDQTIVLLNQINFSNPQTGHYHLNLPIDAGMLKSVKVLHGQQSGIHYANALCGAVNFETMHSASNFVDASFITGNYGLINSRLSLNSSGKKIQQFLSVNYSESSGYTTNTDFNAYKIYYSSSLKVKKNNLFFQAGYVDKAFGANSFYSPRFINQYDHNKGFLSSVTFKTGKKIRFEPSIYQHMHFDHYVLNRQNPGMYQNFHQTNVYGLMLPLNIRHANGQTAFLSEIRNEGILSNNLGFEFTPVIDIPKQDSSYHRKDNRTIYSLSAGHQRMINHFNLQFSVTGCYFSSIEKADLFPFLSLGWMINKRFSAYALAKRTYRLPTFTDLFYQGRTNLGNPDLKHETAYSFEAGVNFQYKSLTSSLVYFNRLGTNVIDWIWLADLQKWQSQNLTELHTQGIEYVKIIKPKPKNHWIYLKYLSRTYALVWQSKNSDNLISNYALDYLKHKLNYNIDIAIFKHFGWSTTVHFQERVGEYLSYDFVNKKDNVLPYKPFWLFDAKLYWQYKQAMIYVESTNIFDQQYYDIGSVVMPGRWNTIGIRIKPEW